MSLSYYCKNVRYVNYPGITNEIEAKLLEEILWENNIPHITRSYHDSAYDGLWQTQSCWGHLEASVIYKEEILEIYSKMT